MVGDEELIGFSLLAAMVDLVEGALCPSYFGHVVKQIRV